MVAHVNWVKIVDAVEMACEMRDVSLREAAEEIGVSPSTLTRLRQGHGVSADGLAALVVWLFPGRVPHWVTVAG